MPSSEVMDFSRGGDLRQQAGRSAATADDLCRDGCFGYEDHDQNPFHVWFKVVDVRKSGYFFS